MVIPRNFDIDHIKGGCFHFVGYKVTGRSMQGARMTLPTMGFGFRRIGQRFYSYEKLMIAN